LVKLAKLHKDPQTDKGHGDAFVVVQPYTTVVKREKRPAETHLAFYILLGVCDAQANTIPPSVSCMSQSVAMPLYKDTPGQGDKVGWFWELVARVLETGVADVIDEFALKSLGGI
jgi:hypothetical protein